MRYAIRCERCQRPAQTEREQTVKREGYVYTHKTVAKTCECGGKIRVELE